MTCKNPKAARRTRRKSGIRRTMLGGPERPRLSVFRSNLHIYAQIIDDLAGRTIVSASSKDKSQPTDKGFNCVGAAAVGKLLAERAKDAGVSAVVFDRNGFRYHGRVKSLAEAAREGGLKF